MTGFIHDVARASRTGLPEAIFCGSKTAAQIEAILERLDGQQALLTRLAPERFSALPAPWQARLDYDPISGTAVLGELPEPAPARIAIVTAGTSDAAVATEAMRTLAFHGAGTTLIQDVGVAGLWRLLARRDEIAAHPVVIACAGMEGALFTVLAGLVPSLVIAVPISNGYGVTAGGHAALTSALGSCAPGVVTVNIDNGYGAACAALRFLAVGLRPSQPAPPPPA